MDRWRGFAIAFGLGFACCAGLSRGLAPVSVAASSPGSFALASPADVVSKAGGAVVSLEALPAPEPAEDANLVARLFGGGKTPEPEPTGVASGVIISPHGFILTNNHVVEGVSKLRARLSDGREFEAQIVGTDPHTDLAVVKIPGRNLVSAPLGNSEHLRPGDSVIAIGNPLGFEQSVSVGVVSAYRRGPFRIDSLTMGDMIQTDAAINQGNSGGGLFSADGKLVGINTATMIPRGGTGSIGIGFAIPVHRAQPVADALIRNQRLDRPWLGLKYRNSQAAFFIHRSRPGVGVLVEEIFPGGPADKAGLRPADIIQQLGNCPVRCAEDIYTFIDQYQPGETVKARLLRGGTVKTVSIALGAKPG